MNEEPHAVEVDRWPVSFRGIDGLGYRFANRVLSREDESAEEGCATRFETVPWLADHTTLAVGETYLIVAVLPDVRHAATGMWLEGKNGWFLKECFSFQKQTDELSLGVIVRREVERAQIEELEADVIAARAANLPREKELHEPGETWPAKLFGFFVDVLIGVGASQSASDSDDPQASRRPNKPSSQGSFQKEDKLRREFDRQRSEADQGRRQDQKENLAQRQEERRARDAANEARRRREEAERRARDAANEARRRKW